MTIFGTQYLNLFERRTKLEFNTRRAPDQFREFRGGVVRPPPESGDCREISMCAHARSICVLGSCCVVFARKRVVNNVCTMHNMCARKRAMCVECCLCVWLRD